MFLPSRIFGVVVKRKFSFNYHIRLRKHEQSTFISLVKFFEDNGCSPKDAVGKAEKEREREDKEKERAYKRERKSI